MRTLEKTIRTYLYKITWILVTGMLIIISLYQLVNEQRRACENATRTFLQIEQVLEENQKELEEIYAEYTETCLHNAEAIARIVEKDPVILDSVEELRRIARLVEVDEIHIFDQAGRIITGTHPEYFDYSFDSGEQMMFFKPMLEDKTLKLVQDITPNTAENKLMQYSAVWSDNGEFIVQVGMEPVNVMEMTEKNELSYIFSLFRVNPETDYYAIDAESGVIVGSTDPETVGRHLSEIGFDSRHIDHNIEHNIGGFHANINGQYSFCVFRRIGQNDIGYVVSVRNLYQRLPSSICLIFVCLMVVAFFLVNAVTRNTNQYVVNEIHGVIQKLKSIADGDLEETVDIQSSAEFVELSSYINRMVKSLLDNSRKMSYVLSKTNLHIGTYEYNSQMKKVRFTEDIPRILSIEEDRMEQLASDTDQFQQFLDEIHENEIQEEEGVYQIGEQYIRLEEIRNQDEVFGVAIDVTSEIRRRRELEKERDIDILTGLYNRRGLDRKLVELFREPEKLGHSAMIMIDADGLKGINDQYGHEKGDVYLKKISEVLSRFPIRGSIAARQGGDEFVLFLYHYASEEELIQAIEGLEEIQTNSFTYLDETLYVPIRFSFGYCLADGSTDYSKLFKEADKKMYQNKVERKKSEGR